MNEQKVVKDLTKIWRSLTDMMVKEKSKEAKNIRDMVDEVIDEIVHAV